MKLACLISGYNNPVSIKVKDIASLSFNFLEDNVKREEKHVKLIHTKTKQQVKFFNNLAPPLAAAFLLFSPICATPGWLPLF
jgi:hypothetical protein